MPYKDLDWDWYKKPLPKTWGDKRNYVMTLAEMQTYSIALGRIAHAVAKEEAQVNAARKAMERKVSPSYMGEPVPLTLAQVLQFKCTMAKEELHLMHWLLDATKRILGERNDEERDTAGNPDASPDPAGDCSV